MKSVTPRLRAVRLEAMPAACRLRYAQPMASPANSNITINYPPPHLPLSKVRDPVRLRCLMETQFNGWVRPGVYIDGNPGNLSQFVMRAVVAPIARIASTRWAIVEIDEYGLPKEQALRSQYVAFLRDRYSLEIPEELVVSPTDAVAPDALQNDGPARPGGQPASGEAPSAETGDKAAAASATRAQRRAGRDPQHPRGP